MVLFFVNSTIIDSGMFDSAGSKVRRWPSLLLIVHSEGIEVSEPIKNYGLMFNNKAQKEFTFKAA